MLFPSVSHLITFSAREEAALTTLPLCCVVATNSSLHPHQSQPHLSLPTGMAHYLPPTILKYFEPRPPLDYVPPPDLHRTPLPPLTGLAAYLSHIPAYLTAHPTPPTPSPTTLTLRSTRRLHATQRHQRRLTHRLARWSPRTPTPSHTRDAYKTLFVARLAHSLTPSDVQKEFEYYGPITSVHLPLTRGGKSRGYAFVEFASSKDLTEAYRDADGRKIGGRRIVVDVERGRTVKGWRPRRLGGGLGGTRLGGGGGEPDVQWTGGG